MELIKTEHSRQVLSDKFLIKCGSPAFYNIQNLLYKTNNCNVFMLNTLFDHKVNFVLKICSMVEMAEHEYEISKKLHDFPNYIICLCTMICNDKIKNIIENEQNITDYQLCNYGTDQVGIVVMKYYKLGSINNYGWSANNLDILKNIIKQVVYASLYSCEIIRFSHGDLHPGNVLIKPKTHPVINYGSKHLIITEYEAVIMDFAKSKINRTDPTSNVVLGLVKFINTIVQKEYNTINFDVVYDVQMLNFIRKRSTESIDFYEYFTLVIDSIQAV